MPALSNISPLGCNRAPVTSRKEFPNPIREIPAHPWLKSPDHRRELLKNPILHLRHALPDIPAIRPVGHIRSHYTPFGSRHLYFAPVNGVPLDRMFHQNDVHSVDWSDYAFTVTDMLEQAAQIGGRDMIMGVLREIADTLSAGNLP